jgi:dihydroorotase-like cyclic amidohydrolase
MDSGRKVQWRRIAADGGFGLVFDLAAHNLPADDQEALAAVLTLLAPVRLQPKRDQID